MWIHIANTFEIKLALINIYYEEREKNSQRMNNCYYA